MFVCNVCNNSFKKKDNLARHMSYNRVKVLGKKIFKCNKCSTLLCRKDALLRHKSNCNNNKERVIELFNEELNCKNELFSFFEWY